MSVLFYYNNYMAVDGVGGSSTAIKVTTGGSEGGASTVSPAEKDNADSQGQTEATGPGKAMSGTQGVGSNIDVTA